MSQMHVTAVLIYGPSFIIL